MSLCVCNKKGIKRKADVVNTKRERERSVEQKVERAPGYRHIFKNNLKEFRIHYKKFICTCV